MGSNTLEIEDYNTLGEKSPISTTVKVAVLCSIIIGVGLAVGLGVGLSGSTTEYVYLTTTSTTTKKPPVTIPATDSTTTKKATTQLPITRPSFTRPEVVTVPPADSGEPWGSIRLPKSIIPSRYALTFIPDLEADTFTGENIITFEVKQTTRYVMVHAHENLAITNSLLKDDGGMTITIEKEFRVPDYEFYVMDVGEDLALGTYTLTMEFNSRLDLSLAGLYTSTYYDDEGNEFKIMSSDMEPADARRAYPCFDEPAMKIIITTTIIHDSKYFALSNMDVKETSSNTPSIGKTTTVFNESPLMPTYLGCFVVCEYDYVENFTARGTPTRIYAPKHHIAAKRADWANEVAAAVMSVFEDILDMPFHLPKCDHISIPSFSSGAMENWGLVTYRERALLWDPVESSSSYKQYVVQVVAHELAHMWFGDAVTIEWWNHLWLNEGFASYFEYLGLEGAAPEFQYLLQQANEKQSVMRVDDTITSQPVVPPYEQIQTPTDFRTMFSSITYSKGGSMLAMMRDNIGDTYFFGGIQKYLKDHEYGNTLTEDLWKSIQDVIDADGGSINITEIMDPWIYQNGFPMLNSTFDGLEMTLTQQQMLSNPNANLNARPDSPYNYMWPVYVKVVGNNITASQDDYIFSDSEDTISFTEPTTTASALKLNPNLMNFYRVNYDVNMWKNIINQLETDYTVFDVRDRSNLVDDAFQLASSERLKYADALEITTYMDQEADQESYIVWDAYSDGSGYLRSMLELTSWYSKFQTYFLSKVKPVSDGLGWDATQGTYLEKQNRALTLALALRYGDQEAKANATQLFNAWMASNDASRPHPDLRSLVYRYGVAEGDDGVPQWEFMLKRYTEEQLDGERDALLYGLTQVQNADLLQRLLEYTKNTSIIRANDFFTCVNRVAYTPLGRNIAWTWYTINWNYLLDRFGPLSYELGSLGPNIVDNYNTEEKYNEVEMWFAATPGNIPGIPMRVNALNQILENIGWMDVNQDDIQDWLDVKINQMP